MELRLVASDIIIDRYGDIPLAGGDVSTSSNKIEIAKTNAKHRIRSNKEDLRNHLEYGAGIGDFIGRPINNALILKIESRIRDSLLEDAFLSSSNMSITTIQHDHLLIIKVTAGESIFEATDKSSEVNISFDTISGDINVY